MFCGGVLFFSFFSDFQSNLWPLFASDQPDDLKTKSSGWHCGGVWVGWWGGGGQFVSRLESLPAIYSHRLTLQLYVLCPATVRHLSLFCGRFTSADVELVQSRCEQAGRRQVQLNRIRNSIRAKSFLWPHAPPSVIPVFYSVFFLQAKVNKKINASNLFCFLPTPHSPFINFDLTTSFFPKATNSRDLHVMCDFGSLELSAAFHLIQFILVSVSEASVT